MHSRLLVIGTNGFVGKHVRLILEKEGIEYFEIEGKNQVNLLNQEEIDVFLHKNELMYREWISHRKKVLVQFEKKTGRKSSGVSVYFVHNG